jgi:tetratricopeptide (TPR) repeat protein
MIVQNEAESLAACLSSVQGIVVEMVVLDTGSVDRTAEIAREWGAQVYDFQWIQDFAAARNAALQQVQGDWVLVLDADEVLVSSCVPALKQVIQQPQCLAVNLLRQEVGAGQSPYSLVSRLFRRHPGLYFSRPYHETIDDSVTQVLQQNPEWKIAALPGVAIQHSGYHPTVIAARDKLARAKSAMEKYLSNHPRDAYICSKLGALYLQVGASAQGVTLLEQGLKVKPIEPAILYELQYHLGIAYTQLQQPDKAEAHYRAALQQVLPLPLKLGAYNNLGSLLKDRGDFMGARATFQVALDIDPNFAVGHYNLGLTCKAMGNLSAAIAHYRRAVTLQPSYAEAYQNLGVVLFKVGRVPESLEAFRHAIRLYEHQESPEAESLRQGVRSLGFEV